MQRSPFGGMSGFGGGLSGPVPKDLWLLLGTLLFTFSLQFFAVTGWMTVGLRLTASVWQRGFLWQLVTYPFVGTGTPNFWFVLELLILFLFGRDVLYRLGRKQFWRLLVMTSAVAAVAAVIVGLITSWVVGPGASATMFFLMQGQRMLLTILIAAFATLSRNATILLFFVLPIEARWFLLLEILFAFLGFLGTRDLAGFVGLCVAVGFTYGALTGWRLRGPLMHARLRLHQLWLRLRLAWMRRRRGMHVVHDDDSGRRDPWVH